MAHETPLSADAEEYLSYLTVERGRAANSVLSYRRDLASYERYLAGRRLALGDVTPAVVEEYLGVARRGGPRGLLAGPRPRRDPRSARLLS